MGEMLSPQDRNTLYRWTEFAFKVRADLSMAADRQPLETMLLLLLIEEQKNTERMSYELHVEIERLKADLI